MTEGMETVSRDARKDATESTQLLKQRTNGTATGAQLMLNIVVCGLGTGLFTLPWSVAGASCFLGVAIVAFVLALNAWTIFLLVEAAEAYQAFDIGSLLSHLPGQLGHTLPRVVNFTIWVGGFFCLVSYVIVIADCAAPFAQLGPWRLKTLASFLVFPLCFLDLLPAGTELLEKLGKGSCGTVRRIRLQGVLRAGKFIDATEGDTKAAAAQEHQLLSSFQHPGIVQTFGLFANDLGVCIVLELCSQGNVSEWVSSNGIFDLDRSLCFFHQLLGAVDYIHQKRIVHRDIKPENCLLTDEARTLKLTDFTSAKVIGTGRGSAAMLSARGTQDFAAPELLLGQMWNERVDMWASGLCFYFFLRGKRTPWPLDEAKKAFLQGQLPEMDWSILPLQARDLLRSCLALKLEHRPPAGHLRSLLEPRLRR